MGALHTPIEVSRSRGFSRFVGRRDEMASLQAALAKAIGGKGQVVGIVADPGVGKSRLCMEFVELCRSRGIAVYEAHGVSHGKAIPFLPILELFRGYYGITEQDSDRAAREKITGRTRGLASRGAIEAALEELSGLARQMELKVLEPFVCVERAELARLGGDEATRQRELREAHRLFTEIGAPIRAEQVAKELAG